MNLILASSSPYRRGLLEKLGLPFTSIASAFDETALPEETAQTLVSRLALEKARCLADTHPHSLIIGSDQVCVIENSILGKPGNFDCARQQLLTCNGKKVEFLTALVLYNSFTHQWQQCVDTYSVQFRELGAAEIDFYLHQEKPYDCAGSFKAEGLGISLFSSMEGNDFNSLIGLPLISLCTMLRQEGVNPLLPAGSKPE
jgi:MAF protein